MWTTVGASLLAKADLATPELPARYPFFLIQLIQCVLQFLAGLGEFVLALVDLVGIAFLHGLVEVGLTLADFMLGVEDPVFPFLFQ